MAYERRRLSTESDKSSTSTTHSTESNGTYSTLSPNLVHPIIPSDQKFSSTGTTRKTTHLTKRTSNISSPAEQILARTKNTFVDLNPYFQCSSLPTHWRKNKSLRFVLRGKPQIDVKPNTRVIILAGNDYNPCATLKNNISWFRDGQAEFNDLRFLGASGRGKKFTLTIVIETTPPQQCTYRRAIKITVDGPRKKRELKSKSDVNETHADESNMDGDSDNETSTRKNSTLTTENNATTTMTTSLSQGSSGLLLLAAAAEQKRKDEEDEPNNHRPTQSAPMEISYSSKFSDKNSPVTHCLSPSSLLASEFSHSVTFSSDDFHSRSSHHVYLPQSTTSMNTSVNSIPTNSTGSTNLLLSFTPTSNRFEFFHPQQRRDQSTMVDASSTTSSSNATAHVLCR